MHHWRRVPMRNTLSRSEFSKLNRSGRTLVENTESEFLAVVWSKCGGSVMYANPLPFQGLCLRKSDSVFSTRDQIPKFDKFDPSGCTPVESTKSEFLVIGWPKQVAGVPIYANHLPFQELHLQIWHSVFCFEMSDISTQKTLLAPNPHTVHRTEGGLHMSCFLQPVLGAQRPKIPIQYFRTGWD